MNYGPSPNSPFSWDADFSNILFTTTAETYQHILDCSCIFHVTTFALGILLSVLLFYLILKKTGKMLKNYRMMLIYNCFVDTQFCLSAYACQFSIKTIDNLIIASLEGPGKYLNFDWQVVVNASFAFSLSVVVTSLPANYYYRYSCIKHNRPLTGSRLFLLYSGAYIAAMPVTFGSGISFHEDGKSRPGFNFGMLWYEVKPVPSLMIIDFRRPITKSFIIYTFLCFGLSYFLSVFFAIKTMTIIRSQQSRYSSKAVQLQKQLSTAMFLQAALPMFISVGPSTVTIIQMVFDLDWDILTLVMFNLYALIPVLNSLSTIMVIRPFREEIIGKILRKNTTFSMTGSNTM
ncbi:unnamed protein product [Bursaphelenchus xylophilus]|uniref:(pine wood nematode) hypothetical protein n=1 Tax=Bursaphelenchus xylophilus TaxID=6326 RepID=A0A1I7RKG6_BURXY|nr:unnamed protein product [Bursaphelenchus xylophilus]CAG9131337.1 unnamed protein product [Bursaphelenchus xylophilus]